MTHATFYNAIAKNHEEIIQELSSNKINVSKSKFIIDEIVASTNNIPRTQITQIVIETVKLFREYLFTNVDFKFGWTYPKLLFNKSGNFVIVTPTPYFIKEDRSFLTDEEKKYFEDDVKWKIQRRRDWQLAKEELSVFLKEEVDSYLEKLPEYDTETLCAMIVSLQFFKVFYMHRDIMEELAKRRLAGDPFEYEEYIKKETAALPKATLDFHDFQNAFKGFKI